MKLLIGGKNRNIYMRKDGSVYYKSGGEKVDVSYMFKKNGDLKKQYIGGVKESSRIKNNIKFYGGNPIQLRFQAINFNSDINTVTDNREGLRKELLKLLQIAYNVVLERIITNRVNNVVDPNHKELLKGLLFALQYDLLKSDRDIVNEYNIKKKSEGGRLYYKEIENIFMHRDFNYWAIIEKLNNLTNKLLNLDLKKTNRKITRMCNNIKKIIGSLTHINATVVSPSTEVPVEKVESEEPVESLSLSLETKNATGVFDQKKKRKSELLSITPPQNQQEQQESSVLSSSSSSSIPLPLPQPPTEEQPTKIEEQPTPSISQQKGKQPTKIEEQQKGKLPPPSILPPSSILQPQLDQEVIEIIQYELSSLYKSFVQKRRVDNTNVANKLKSLDSIIQNKSDIMENIINRIIQIDSIFQNYKSNNRDDLNKIMTLAMFAYKKVKELKENVENIQSLIEEIPLNNNDMAKININNKKRKLIYSINGQVIKLSILINNLQQSLSLKGGVNILNKHIKMKTEK